MEDLSLHVLDIVENSLQARARNVDITLTESEKDNMLILEVADDGEGMDEVTVRQAVDPFFTTRARKKVGLGLALLAQAAREADGKLEITSTKGRGTKVIVTFQLHHIDRKPLGNMEETAKCLRLAHPDVRFRFEHRG